MIVVVAAKKAFDQRRWIEARIPHHSGHDEVLQRVHVPSGRAVVALFEEASHAHPMEEVDVFSEHVIIRERLDEHAAGDWVVEGGIAADVGHGERGDIVPDVQGAAVGAAREGLPAGDRALEARVARVAQRRSEVGLDVAQLDDDVLPWPRARRESRPFVRQRLNESMRELIFDGLGDGVHRTEERAAW